MLTHWKTTTCSRWATAWATRRRPRVTERWRDRTACTTMRAVDSRLLFRYAGIGAEGNKRLVWSIIGQCTLENTNTGKVPENMSIYCKMGQTQTWYLIAFFIHENIIISWFSFTETEIDASFLRPQLDNGRQHPWHPTLQRATGLPRGPAAPQPQGLCEYWFILFNKALPFDDTSFPVLSWCFNYLNWYMYGYMIYCIWKNLLWYIFANPLFVFLSQPKNITYFDIMSTTLIILLVYIQYSFNLPYKSFSFPLYSSLRTTHHPVRTAPSPMAIHNNNPTNPLLGMRAITPLTMPINNRRARRPTSVAALLITMRHWRRVNAGTGRLRIMISNSKVSQDCDKKVAYVNHQWCILGIMTGFIEALCCMEMGSDVGGVKHDTLNGYLKFILYLFE